MTGVLIKRENLDTNIWREYACEDEERGWGDNSTGQGTPRMLRKPLETRAKA